MATLDVYERQAQLVVRVLPVVSAYPQFALKGGTAINLFVRDMPRMSVDIDLVYLPIEDRGLFPKPLSVTTLGEPIALWICCAGTGAFPSSHALQS